MIYICHFCWYLKVLGEAGQSKTWIRCLPMAWHGKLDNAQILEIFFLYKHILINPKYLAGQGVIPGKLFIHHHNCQLRVIVAVISLLTTLYDPLRLFLLLGSLEFQKNGKKGKCIIGAQFVVGWGWDIFLVSTQTVADGIGALRRLSWTRNCLENNSQWHLPRVSITNKCYTNIFTE